MRRGQSHQEGQTDAYKYEKSFDEFMQQVSREILQESVGREADSRKKTIHSKFRVIEIPKRHVLCRTPLGFKMPPYWQEQCIYMGQQNVFEEAEQAIERLTGQRADAKQIERLVHSYGELLEQKQAGEENTVVDERLHYGMMDGGMVLTREDDWKEMKLARIFVAKNHLETGKSKDLITQSHYVAHLGGHRHFFRKVEKCTDALPNMIWIADGAKWIWDWVNKSYPKATQILDYFHCKEKLCQFAKEVFSEKPEELGQWVNQQEELLLSDQIEIVMANITLVPCKRKAKALQRSLLTYYENNRCRMKYKTYRDQGMLIGSGPVEAAHRHVIRARMERSGQRWTLKGAQQVANLRTARYSGDWETVKNQIRNPCSN